MYKSLLAALALAASSAVAAPTGEGAGYYLTLTLNGTKTPLEVVEPQKGTGKHYFQAVSDANKNSTGTQVSFSGPYGKNLALYLGTSTTVGFKVPEVGAADGVAKEVVGEKGVVQKQWDLSKDGQVTHKLQAALDGFYACYADFGEFTFQYLAWGTPNTKGEPAAGCESTEVHIADFEY